MYTIRIFLAYMYYERMVHMETKVITGALRMLGIGRHYLGYHITVQAVQMTLMDSKRLLCVKQGTSSPWPSRSTAIGARSNGISAR